MIFLIILSFVLALIFAGGCVIFYVFDHKITQAETRLIELFSSRTDVLPGLFEVSKHMISRHSEIFNESIDLRKKEFSLISISQKLESFVELEEKIHHEINFIFQVCNKNPKLNSQKTFLYIRDVILIKSTNIGKEFKKYNKIILAYNSLIRYKNYSVVGLLIPYTKKTVL